MKHTEDKIMDPVELEAEITQLQSSVRKLMQAQKKSAKTTGNLRQELKRVSRRLSCISPHEIEPKLDRLDGRVDHLNGAYVLLIEKATIITEVCFWMRLKDPGNSAKCAEMCIWAYDGMPDDWWSGQPGATIGLWYKAILNAWTDYQAVLAEGKQAQNPFDLSIEQPSKRMAANQLRRFR
jgi:hypothetical protein